MQTNVEEISSVQRKITVELPSEVVNQAFDKTLKYVQQNTALRGFRKGKVPLAQISKMYGDSIAADVAEELINDHLFKAIQDNSISPLSSPTLSKIDLPKKDETYSFTATIDVMPPLEVSNYSDISIKAPKYEVTQDAVKREIEQIRVQLAKVETAKEGKTAEDGMLVDVSCKTIIDEQEVPSLTFEHRTVKVGQKQLSFCEDCDSMLSGSSKGSEHSKTTTIASTYFDERYAGKAAQITLTVNELYEQLLPELNDEFAKDAGFENLDAMTADVEQGCKSRADNMRRSTIEQRITDVLCERHTFDVPPSLVEPVIDDYLRRIMGGSRDKSVVQKLIRDPKMREGFKEPATKEVKKTMLLMEIANKESIKATEDDIKEELAKLDEYIKSQSKSPKEYSDMKRRITSNVQTNLTLSKTLQFIIDKAKIEDEVTELPANSGY